MNENLVAKFKLSNQQVETYTWLKEQQMNTDDVTLCYWAKKYALKRIKEVVEFGRARQKAGQEIRNFGGWVNSFLKAGKIVVNDNCQINREFAVKFMKVKKWSKVEIYEKYLKEEVTGDDLPLTIEPEDFKRSLEALYEKSELYK
jgi:hypothetical protein